MDVTVNDTAIPIPPQVYTWGDFLDWLETSHLQAGQCITNVLIDAQEEINYRSPSKCSQSLDTLGHIRVESGSFSKVIRESLCELDAEVRGALVTTTEIVRLLETRNEEQANVRLAQLLDSIRLMYAVFSEDLGWIDSPDADNSRAAFSATLENALRQLVLAQENHLWVSICDVLEYEITPMLEAWQKLVERTRVEIS